MAKTRFDPARITCVLTSCGRWDFLVRSIDTFLQFHQPGRFILVEDSADRAFAGRIRQRWPEIELVLNEPRIGQLPAIDKAYAMVTTPYIVHLEDDWVFIGAMDVDDAEKVLEENPRFVAVCFSMFRRLKLRQRIFQTSFRHGPHVYADMSRAHRDWHGYSFYPTLLRRSTWLEFGPYAPLGNERTISRAMKNRGLALAYQLPGIGVHVGSGHSVFDPARSGERRRITGGWWKRLTGRDPFAPGAR